MNLDTYNFEILNKIFTTPEKGLQFLIDDHNPKTPEKNIVIYNLMKSLVSGEIDNSSTRLFLEQYEAISNSKDINLKIKLGILMNGWLSHTQNDTEKNVIMFDIILKTISEMRTNDSKIHINLTKKIWNFGFFRKLIKHMPKFNTGLEYEFGGMFRSLFTPGFVGSGTLYFNQLLDSIDPLIKDESIHDDLLMYLYEVLKKNVPYTYEDIEMSGRMRCSGIIFVMFINKILIKLIKYYKLEKILDHIKNSDKHIMKNYEIENLPSILHKIYGLFMYSIQICNVPVIKIYYHFTEELKILNNQRQILRSRQQIFDRAIHDINLKMDNLKPLLDDGDNDFVQKMCYTYKEIHPTLHSEEIFSDIVIYIDYINDFEKITKLYGKTCDDLIRFTAYIMSGANKSTTNFHLRYYAANIIFSIISEKGFDVFENLFSDLFGYISDVDFFKWSNFNTAIQHQKKIIQTIIQLLDYGGNLESQSQHVISGTLYNIIKRGLEILSDFINLIKATPARMVRSQNVIDFSNDMVDTITMTLVLHRELYNKKIISTIYSEVEEKYAIFINELLTTSTNTEHIIYKHLKRPDLASSITKLAYRSVYDHIKNFGDDNKVNDAMVKISDTVVKFLDLSGLNKDECQLINSIISTYKVDTRTYPEEFLDPLLCIPIKDPVKIPLIDEFFDRTTIISQIFESGQNPYTRQPLTLEILNEYNSRESVINEIEDFKKRKAEFESKSQS